MKLGCLTTKLALPTLRLPQKPPTGTLPFESLTVGFDLIVGFYRISVFRLRPMVLRNLRLRLALRTAPAGGLRSRHVGDILLEFRA